MYWCCADFTYGSQSTSHGYNRCYHSTWQHYRRVISAKINSAGGLIYAEVIYILKADNSNSNSAACSLCQSVAPLETHMMQSTDGSHRRMAENYLLKAETPQAAKILHLLVLPTNDWTDLPNSRWQVIGRLDYGLMYVASIFYMYKYSSWMKNVSSADQFCLSVLQYFDLHRKPESSTSLSICLSVAFT